MLWQRSTPPSRARIERARAAIRRVVWTLLTLRPGGSSWISVCGRELANWYVLDLDATVVTCTSRKEDAADSFGHMPLRPGTAPPNDVTDHKAVLASAFRQLPLSAHQ